MPRCFESKGIGVAGVSPPFFCKSFLAIFCLQQKELQKPDMKKFVYPPPFFSQFFLGKKPEFPSPLQLNCCFFQPPVCMFSTPSAIGKSESKRKQPVADPTPAVQLTKRQQEQLKRQQLKKCPPPLVVCQTAVVGFESICLRHKV